MSWNGSSLSLARSIQRADVAALRGDRLEHLEDLLVRAAVERAPQRGDPGRDRDVQVGVRRADQPDRRGRAVLLVVGVEDEQRPQRGARLRIDDVRLRRDGEHHAQEVRLVVEPVVRVDERLADRLLVGERRDRRQLGHAAAPSAARRPPGRRDRHRPGRTSTGRRPPRRGWPSGGRPSGTRRRCRLNSSWRRVWRRTSSRPAAELPRSSGARRGSAGRRPRGRWTPRRAARSGSRGSAGCPASPSRKVIALRVGAVLA